MSSCFSQLPQQSLQHLSSSARNSDVKRFPDCQVFQVQQLSCWMRLCLSSEHTKFNWTLACTLWMMCTSGSFSCVVVSWTWLAREAPSSDCPLLQRQKLLIRRRLCRFQGIQGRQLINCVSWEIGCCCVLRAVVAFQVPLSFEHRYCCIQNRHSMTSLAALWKLVEAWSSFSLPNIARRKVLPRCRFL